MYYQYLPIYTDKPHCYYFFIYVNMYALKIFNKYVFGPEVGQILFIYKLRLLSLPSINFCAFECPSFNRNIA